MKRFQGVSGGWYFALFLMAAGGACAPAHMAVPKDVGSMSDEIVISDRSGMSGALVDESFTMGPYKVTDVNRKWNSASTSTIVGVSSSEAKGGYTFGLKSPDGEYKGTCASHLDEKSTGFLGGTLGTQNFNVLCECGGPAQATFSINADTTSHYKGTVTARSANYQIEGVYTDEKGSSTSKPIGYEVRGTEPVGAVEVAGKGRVWLSKSLDAGAKADVACLFAGLLLYQPPTAKIDK
jgi:hypothetical protein